ncbi:hypothetical protein B484DRAFT_264504 [Ochromonadaceae sp. CCMP2298]|nr:hypothetical protein B484DRAFT_264504 [Ochromonadaceae sp. CCMP2298]
MSIRYGRSTVLHLYKQLLREAQKLPNYNFREHALRRIKFGFRKDSTLKDMAAMAKFAWGLGQLDVIRRQVIIGEMYPGRTSVVVVQAGVK